jgi:DNA-binding GntR family transcriptional regulator
MTNRDRVHRSAPVAVQVGEILRERIRQGDYPADVRMPSEERLAEELQVSRASIRTALAALAAEGFIRRRHGDGTYASPHAFAISVRPGGVWDIERQIRESGRHPSIQVLEYYQRPAAPEEAALLLTPPGELLQYMRWLFCADGAPAALISNAVSTAGLAANIPPEAACLPPLEFLKRYHQRHPSSGYIRFNAILAGGEIAGLLQVQPGTPLLNLDVLTHDPQGCPLVLAREIYPSPDGFKMQLTMPQ